VSCRLVLYCVHVHALSYRTLFDRGASLRRRSNDAREFVRLRETQCSSRVAVVVGRNVSKPSWSHCNTGRPVRLLNTRVTPFRHLCRRQCRRRACLLLLEVSGYYIIVGVSADEASKRLTAALPTLREMGADVVDVGYRGSFAFAAQKGFPAKTVLRKARNGAETNANQPRFKAYVAGAIYSACAGTLSDTVRWFSVLRSHMY